MGDIVNNKILRRIELELLTIRHFPHNRRAADLIKLAEQLGRFRHARGKEPTYVKTSVPRFAHPLTIPGHGGDLRIGTVRAIVDVLLADVDVWQDYLSTGGNDDNDYPTRQS